MHFVALVAVLVAALAFGGFRGASAHDHGIVSLDYLSFSRVIDGRRDALVAFTTHSWDTEGSNGLKGVADAHDDLIVARVPCNDAVEDDEEGGKKWCTEQFGVDSFDSGNPVIKYFAKSDDGGSSGKPGDATAYGGDDSSEAYVDFVHAQRTPKLRELKALVGGFTDAKKADKAKALAAAEKLVAEVTEPESAAKYGKLVLAMMKRVADKGKNFPLTEATRLQKLIESTSVPDAKKPEFRQRIAVLDLFEPTDDKVEA